MFLDGFYNAKRVFVTGHTGFKGSWLCLWLARQGAQVRGFSLPQPPSPGLFEAARLDDLLDDVRGDIRDHDALARAVREFKPHIVIHMAAQALVRQSYSDPLETFSTNVLGTACLFEAARGVSSLGAIVNVTSDKCYANKEWVWGYRESDELGGDDPYSSSKGCAELVAHAYAKAFFQGASAPAIASARAGNVIGGGDFGEDRLIPDLVRATKLGKPARIRNPLAIRPWQHVLEPLSGYLLLAKRLFEEGRAFAGGWNFGPETARDCSVECLADAFCSALGSGASWELDVAAHPHEARSLRLECAKARLNLPWRTRLDLPQALDWTAAWYRDWLNGASNSRDIVLVQLAAYEELVNAG